MLHFSLVGFQRIIFAHQQSGKQKVMMNSILLLWVTEGPVDERFFIYNAGAPGKVLDQPTGFIIQKLNATPACDSDDSLCWMKGKLRTL